MKFEVGPIPPGTSPGWTVTQGDGGTVEISSRFGTLSYGLRPEGYDGWVFAEHNGGGAVTLPYTYDKDGNLLIGLIEENRCNMGGYNVLCVIGGFVDPQETHDQAQVRESQEEAGVNTASARKLQGLSFNPNRAFFVADASKGEGIHAYAIRISFTQLTQNDRGFGFADGVQCPSIKKPGAVIFLPWREAVKATPDGIALAAIARLLVELL